MVTIGVAGSGRRTAVWPASRGSLPQQLPLPHGLLQDKEMALLDMRHRFPHCLGQVVNVFRVWSGHSACFYHHLWARCRSSNADSHRATNDAKMNQLLRRLISERKQWNWTRKTISIEIPKYRTRSDETNWSYLSTISVGLQLASLQCLSNPALPRDNKHPTTASTPLRSRHAPPSRFLLSR